MNVLAFADLDPPVMFHVKRIDPLTGRSLGSLDNRLGPESLVRTTYGASPLLLVILVGTVIVVLGPLGLFAKGMTHCFT